ncbi:AraC family transcriptional regulator [Shewanella salipaludis]|uniref:Helix-turn-helix transcriptional regulator n=1 Tax=Shewanella salipaludis TaxID=2723052 RepID=A0A972JMY5_9GAMM|nr:helix-turn-helix transcriptional regulator [Shewanella salipaludis]NMH65616.1 helix-turn-helix transcriptional regulator [Shewanella salipaludis]
MSAAHIPIPPSTLAAAGLSLPIMLLKRRLNHNERVQKHSHAWGQLIYASRGLLTVITNSGRYIVPPEQAVWVAAHTQHEVIAMTDASLTSLYLDEAESLGLKDEACVLAITPLLSMLLAEASVRVANDDWPGPGGRLLRVIRDLLCQAEVVALNLPYPRDPRLLQITRTLLAEPGNDASLAFWQQHVGASSRTLARLFKAQTGLSFSQWKQRLKLQLAVQLLGRGESVLGTALSLGYESSSAFGFMFKQQMGISPSEFISGGRRLWQQPQAD